MSFELTVAIIINVISIGFFAGVLKTTQKHHEKMIEEIKESQILREQQLRSDIKDHFDRLESKQDKHNNLIERMVVVEESTKSAHKRIDGIINGNV